MIKSVTIKDAKGKLIFKVICRKNRSVEKTIDSQLLGNIEIDIRDEKNCKMLFVRE